VTIDASQVRLIIGTTKSIKTKKEMQSCCVPK